MELGFWTYYHFNELTRHEIELYFEGITKKLNILEHQLHTTAALYNKEHAHNVKILEEQKVLSRKGNYFLKLLFLL